MNQQKQKALIKDIANIFAEHQAEILEKWLKIMKRENIIVRQEEVPYFKNGFEKLISDFIQYLSVGDFESYYEGNEEVAMEVAYNDIDFKTFIRVFHFFEESYAKILLDNVPKEQAVDYLGAVDMLHHETIAIVAERYFEVKDNTIFALAKLTEQRDNNTGMHLERTREYAVILAKQLALDEDYISLLYKVGPLHDIGKVAICDDILLKPGRLTDEEFNQMKQHTTIGAETLAKIIDGQQLTRGFFLMGLEIILSHHERYDGTGYPHGLKGEEIPLSARIFAVADVYDALISKRPYKEPLSHENAVEIIANNSGSHFDPQIIEAFLSVEQEFKRISEQYSQQQ
ncbi:HD-GYP domain-containing protein [Desulfuribacillus alkaliarsenatis]|uniref:HD-GYP domain-containing protein n=1 Tax=Desulfuribacillus alkaliarsenatis TaxID=766136 RepID=A0A1E5G0U1_9FIRM|nr:HD domain-containing phosphohydrolase [Desulfuribacillus alkaliarsenatis]OEF96527.1 hypothetical protein BHF68_07695 [Desulfuribacillus alkaliarsenatis]